MTEQRFWSKVNKTESCWLWTGCCFSSGYGALSVDDIPIYTHRYSYEIHKGKIPEGLLIRHTCDNPPCVNPNHLLVGTRADNVMDMVERNRQARGSKNGQAKLTEDDVNEIKIFREFGFTQQELGKMYGVSQSTITRLLSKKRWGHL
jgi:hypothetical protein